MLSFKEKLYDNEVEGSKEDLVEIFNDLLDAADSDEEYIKQQALKNEKVVQALAGKEPKKVIVIKSRLVNIVV